MKKWKVLLIIAMMITALMCFSGCTAYYHPDNSEWAFGTDGSIYYSPSNSNWLFKVSGF